MAIPISRTAHQCCVTHWTMVKNVSWLKSRFLRRTSGPSASTLRHFKNTSQYPGKNYCYSSLLLTFLRFKSTLIVVTGRARTETYSRFKIGQFSSGDQVSSGNTSVIVAWFLTSQFTKLSFVDNCFGGKLTPSPTVFDADRVTAFSLLTNLKKTSKNK